MRTQQAQVDQLQQWTPNIQDNPHVESLRRMQRSLVDRNCFSEALEVLKVTYFTVIFTNVTFATSYVYTRTPKSPMLQNDLTATQ